jgi:predicted transcriptional regulator
MPNLKEMLAKAKEQEAAKKEKANSASKKLTRNVRPDSLLQETADPHKVRPISPVDNQPTDNPRAAADKLIEQNKSDSNLVQIPQDSACETGSKEIANGYQTGIKRVAETGSKEIANGYQTDSSESVQNPKQVAERIAKQVAIGKQTGSKQVAKLDFEALSGHEKKLLLLIFKECLRTGSLQSPPITLSHISESLETTSGTAKSAINRLIKKGFTWRYQSKTGRGGWIKFGLLKEHYQDLRIRETDSKEIANGYQTDSKRVAERVAEQIASASSSSSILNNKRTTTTGEDDFETWLAEIDFSVYSPQITPSLVRRCFELHPNLKPIEFEKLLSRFSVHLHSKNNGVKNARGLLISFAGQLAKGQVPLEEIEAPEDVLARKWIEEMKQAKAERNNLEKEACDLGFEEWFEGVSQESKDQLAPPNSVMPSGHPTQKMFLKSHFIERVWPEQKQILIQQRPSTK